MGDRQDPTLSGSAGRPPVVTPEQERQEIEQRVCVICGVTVDVQHVMHNADPVKVGRCCDLCNTVHVIPRRLAMWHDLNGKNT